MPKLIVIENPERWQFSFDDVQVLTPAQYIAEANYQEQKNLKVINLCKDYQYQSLGYYVSLLAEARDHKVMPGISTLQAFRFPYILREDVLDFDELIQNAFKQVLSDKVEFNIYFGLAADEKRNKLANQLFQMAQAPFVKAVFSKKNKWQLNSLRPITLAEIPEADKPLMVNALEKYLLRKREIRYQEQKKFDLAILFDPDDQYGPSDKKAMAKFVKAAEQVGFYVELITKHDFAKLVQFDALFIRETTNVDHHTFRFARRAQSLGLVVIDDPDSILKCTNKVYLAELLVANKIPAPKSVVVSRDNYKSLTDKLAFPFILKQPDGAFSKGVYKITDEKMFKDKASAMFHQSDLLIAQEFLPTAFDWRVGIIDNKVLYVCKYYMAGEHWQIMDWTAEGDDKEGNVDTIDPEQVPSGLLKTALKATSLIGNGLYGVDMKEINGKYYVIEINDNPNIDAGIEDKLLKEKLYISIMEVFYNRLKSRNI
ncbi:MAG TPA: RimK family protein [Cyclobacteriaceae bacterium]|mgnify:CR=1 FL=1|nr:RimK family protein [Cyclobacteriaceae bacterium]